MDAENFELLTLKRTLNLGFHTRCAGYCFTKGLTQNLIFNYAQIKSLNII